MFWGAPLATAIPASRRASSRSRARAFLRTDTRARIAAASLFAILAASCGTSSEVSSGPSPVKCGVRMQADSTGFSPDGGTGTLSVSADRECTWSAQTDAAWLSLASATGQGSASLRFTVAKNGDPAARSARIRVQDQQLEISQRATACDVQVSSNREAIGPEGGTRTIRVTASSAQCTWTAASSTSWITVAHGSSGQGNGAVEFRIPASNGPPRTGTVTIAGKVVTIEQSADACSVEIDPPAFTIPPAGGRGTIRVAARQDCRWTATRDDASRDWIEIVAGESGSGSGETQFTVRAHDGPARTGRIQIANQTVTITQGSNCGVSVDPTVLSIGAQQTSQSIRVESPGGCEWSAVSSAPWMTVSAGATGSGDGRVDLAIAANQGPERTASVSIGGRDVTVTQAAGCTFTLSSRTADLPPQGGSTVVAIATAAACAWTAASHAGWVSLSPSSGTGPAQVQLIAPANPSIARSGTVTIGGNAVTVNQASPCTFRTVPDALDYPAAGGIGAVLVIVSGGCSWEAESGAPWIRMTAGETGTGDGHIEFAVDPNTGAARSGWITVAGLRVTVSQSAP
jgi:hypothetical protein